MTRMIGGPGAAAADRRKLIVDGAQAAGLAAFLIVGTYFASHDQPDRRAFDTASVALVVVAAAALAVRSRYPVAVMGVVFGVTLVYFALGYANGPIWLALVVSYFSAAVRGHRVAAAITAATGFAIFPWLVGATVDPGAGWELLLDHRAGVELLRLALTDAGSPWAAVAQAVCATLPPLHGRDREAVLRLAAAGPPGEQVGLAPFAPPEYMPEPRRPVSLPLPTFPATSRGAGS